MKIYVIYHANCFDGICSAWVVSKKYPGATFIPMNHGEKIFDVVQKYNIEGGNRVVMVDFSVKRDDMDWLSGVGDLLVLDHHKTAEKELEGAHYAVFDMNKSGASLAWEYFYPSLPVPQVVQYIADRDLWKFELHNSENVNSFIQSFPMTLESYEMLAQMLDNSHGFDRAVEGGASINRYKKTMVENMCKTATIRNIGGYKVPVVNASMLFSEVGEKLCVDWQSVDGGNDFPFGAYYFDRLIDGTRQWGMRSRGDFDVSVVAKIYGGGGHKNAAGFQEPLNGPILRNSEI